jgi:crossover junction endodeoxyribonuclease RusA
MVEIRVYGSPAPQGSKRFLGLKGGKGIMVESSKAVKPWREAVKQAALEAMQSRSGAVQGALVVEMVFTVLKPKSAPKNRQTWPDRKPDLSKLIRSTEDALSDAGVWEDDARVVEYRMVSKVYPNEGPGALHIPGAVIRVFQVNE